MNVFAYQEVARNREMNGQSISLSFYSLLKSVEFSPTPNSNNEENRNPNHVHVASDIQVKTKKKKK